MKTLVAALLLASSACYANDFYRQTSTGNYLMLTNDPCALSKELLDHARIRSEYVDDRGLRNAVLYYNGRTLSACYAIKGGLVRAIDEQGDNLGPLPEVDFNNEETAKPAAPRSKDQT
jgi:hypothetical protein